MSAASLLLGIAGAGTDAGKTLVTAGLLRAAVCRAYTVQGLKPVQTGCGQEPLSRAPDPAVWSEAAPLARATALHCFGPACSPWLAARQAGVRLNAEELARTILRRARHADLTLVEGTGGVLTPLNEGETMADLFARLQAPVLLVAANRLGCVDHALLSLEALRARGCTICGFVLTEIAPPEKTDACTAALALDNARAIAGHGGITCLACLPFAPELVCSDAQARQLAWDRTAALLEPALNSICGLQPQGRRASKALLRFDRHHLWHPYAPAGRAGPLWAAASTTHNRIRLADGRELVDGMSSWWAAIHGYNRPELLEALRAQAARMPHVMFGGLTHAPAVELARELLRLAPASLKRVFYADSGSVAVEAAMKMALQYHQGTGAPGRTVFVAARGAYHGDTLGAMSLCDPVTGMHALFRHALARQIFVERPACPYHAPWNPDAALPLVAALERHAPRVAAVILEPLVQGAGGMWMYHPEYLRSARRLCDEHGVLLILDEIATGFGRTGSMFACQQAGVAPDILCLGKGLTGGVLSLAAVLSSSDVAAGVSRDNRAFMHGPTFMANPLACAVARASLGILATGAWHAEVRALEKGLRAGLTPCRNLPGVRDVRVLGGAAAVQMDAPVNVRRLQRFFVARHKVWIRPFADLIYLMPPYCTNACDLERLCAAVACAVREGLWK